MTISGIAFDCCWLIELDSKKFAEKYAAMQLADRMVKNKISLLMDHEGHLHREYSRYMPGMVTGKAILEMLTQKCVRYVSGKPKSECATSLTTNGFDPSDIPYVGTAQNGLGVLITSEEKHLNPERCALIADKCNVLIIGSEGVPGLLS
ncbi:hypothetical protein MycrhDRAFT_4487 [Mycolicibacterium rhodesiae JS60]|nr:hypothetical protein MycrhDRAFT_4487 [Mycolicibacterium rhodesiae JS60]